MMRFITLSFITFMILSCGNEAPSVSFPIYHILIYEDQALQVPNSSMFLSVYFVINDEDGMNDIKSVKLTHIDSEYSWVLKKEELKSYDWENKTYYGYSFFEYNNAKSLLLGDYNIEVEDSAGNIGNSLFRVEIDEPSNINISKDEFRIPDINYRATTIENGKEIKIENGKYFSVEVKFLDNPDLFNGGRKKFTEDQKIVVNPNENKMNGNLLSIKINQDVNETIVYF